MMFYCVPTPYSLANDPDDPVDVFAEIFPQYIDPDDPSQGQYPYWEEKRKALWARFHDTGIGNPDTDYWIRCMKGKAAEMDQRYLIRFRVWTEYQAKLAATTTVDLSDSAMDSESVQKEFDPPNVDVLGVTAEDYLSGQNINRYHQDTHGGTDSETVRDYNRSIENPFEYYAAEFDKLFYRGM
ncbi:MAG: hypothetical protein IIZ24_00870 [Candidatus Methanomethylophilus sp.]|nr:hypothetical protein [Methanomethylophilus sp.]